MNNESTYGESSCKRQENGDVVAECDRPLKKARFAWQVKGRHRLKNDTPKLESQASTAANSDKSTSSSDSEIDSNHVGSAEQNLEILGDYLLKQDFNTLDSVITDSEKSLLKPCSNLSIEAVQCPRYVSSYEVAAQGASRSVNTTVVPMSHQTVNANEDLCIARWQAKQMAKGFVDNTINRVLDSWMVSPLPAEIGNRFLALDVAEFINNLPGDNSIENEGILMAISAHGLQNAPNASSSLSTENCKPNYSSIANNVFPSPPSSPITSDDEMTSSQKPCTKSVPSKEPQNSDHQTVSNNEDCFNYNLFPDTMEESNAGNEIQDNNNFYHENGSADDDFTDHFNFMDAAVSFAIQNKGLTSYGTDYG